jgi:glycosyltransferase involved in cell wall biosynthesis
LETLESLKNQSLTDFEVIIVDDCSTDDTVAKVKNYCARNDNFKVIELEHNSNRPAVARNIGIKNSEAKFIAFCDHDDIWSRNKLDRQLQVVLNRADTVMVHSNLWDFTKKSRMLGLFLLPNPYRRITSYKNLQKNNTVQTSSVLIYRQILDELGGFDDRIGLRAIEDYQLWLRVSEKYKILYISENHGYYRHTKISTSKQSSLKSKHLFLDNYENTAIYKNRNSLIFRLFRKILGYPLAIYYHLIDAPIRVWLGVYPRTFE